MDRGKGEERDEERKSEGMKRDEERGRENIVTE